MKVGTVFSTELLELLVAAGGLADDLCGGVGGGVVVDADTTPILSCCSC